MTIEQFAETYRVRLTGPTAKPWSLKGDVQIDSCAVVEGRCGYIGVLLPNEAARFAARNEARLVLLLLAVPRNANMDRTLTHRGKMAQQAGMTLKVRSGAESEWYFDPTDPNQAAVAIRLVGAKHRRTVNLTPEQRSAIGQRLKRYRAEENPWLEGHLEEVRV